VFVLGRKDMKVVRGVVELVAVLMVDNLIGL
jgi:hypothetical protein